MNFIKHFKHFFGLLVLTFSLGGLLTSAGAGAAQCKGLAKSKCESASDCSWVKSYTTSKGAKVDAYCRAKPSKSGKKSSSGDKASATTKDAKKDTAKAKTKDKSEKSSDTKKTEKKKSSTASEKKDKKKSTSKSEKSEKKTDKK